MTISTILATEYSSAPDGQRLLITLDVTFPDGSHKRLVQSYEDETLHVDGLPQVFEACAFDYERPDKDTSGNQSLKFAVGILGDEGVEELIATALDSGQEVYVTYREYLLPDRLAPASAPVTMLVQGGEFDDDQLYIEGAYFDMLNSRWPRDRYTLLNAPGIKYL